MWNTTAAFSASVAAAAFVENLVISGVGHVNVIGNDLNNQIVGNTQANYLMGGFGHDTLVGGGGADTLHGGGGIDSMVGGQGNDTYWVNLAADDLVVEYGDTVTGGTTVYGGNAAVDAGGIDTVIFQGTSGEYDLGASGLRLVGGANNGKALIENLTLGGTSAINGKGNELNNKIQGNNVANVLRGESGADTIIGGGGNDTLRGGDMADRLTGGTGADTFQFDNRFYLSGSTKIANAPDRILCISQDSI